MVIKHAYSHGIHLQPATHRATPIRENVVARGRAGLWHFGHHYRGAYVLWTVQSQG